MSDPSQEAPSAQILDLTLAELQAQLTLWNEPRFRVEQLWRWIYVHLASNFSEMTNLPLSLRERLSRLYSLSPLTLVDQQISADRLTHKVLFALPDGETIESVLMEYDQRRTVCVSTQVGCPIGCVFCATGQCGFTRNLTSAEIIAQALYFARKLRDRALWLNNIVLMGMGEPMLNYDAVWQAVERWNDHRGFDLSARKITISTAGHVPGILRLADEELPVGLAVSLHAADDELRDQLVPLNRTYPLSDLTAACRDYERRSGRRITFEYALVDGVNDAVSQAHQLARLMHGLSSHVNLIPLNPTPEGPYRAPPLHKVRAFQQALAEHRIPTTVRVRRGLDVQAGCGQLRRRQAAENA
jgi:23S rRNA (adenine2503-C2)-methyltransferase